MKNSLLIFLLAFLLFSCKKSSSSQDNTVDLRISVDTVLIDTGEDFINLRNGIYYSGLSHDKKYLFNSGATSPYLERINLETLKFEEKMIFDDDGPNAFGEYVNGVSSDVNNNLILTAWDGTSIFNMQKEKLKKYLLMKRDFRGDGLEGREQFISQIIPSEDYTETFGLVQNFANGDVFFVILHDNTQTLEKLRLDGFEKAEEFAITFSVGGGASIANQMTEITRLGNKLIINNPAFSRIAVYDLDQRDLRYYDCKPMLTESEKVGRYNRNVPSMEEFDEERVKVEEEVNFLPLMRDLTSDKYVRLSTIGKSKRNVQGRPEITDNDVFVSILNDSFEVIKEVQVANGIGKLLTRSFPQQPFFKDGKIWLYLNLNDELAFVRLGLEY
jgi:hypothetical protein